MQYAAMSNSALCCRVMKAILGRQHNLRLQLHYAALSDDVPLAAFSKRLYHNCIALAAMLGLYKQGSTAAE